MNPINLTIYNLKDCAITILLRNYLQFPTDIAVGSNLGDELLVQISVQNIYPSCQWNIAVIQHREW